MKLKMHALNIALLFFFLLSTPVYSYLNPNLIETRFSYVYPLNQKFRDLYSGGVGFGLEYDRVVNDYLSVWVEIDYFKGLGNTLSCAPMGLTYSTEMTLVPISSGLKFIYQTEYVTPYLGAGIEATWVQVETENPYLIHNNSKWGVGGHFKAGVHITPPYPYLLLDFFVDYSLLKLTMHGSHHPTIQTHRSNLDRLYFGAAFGATF